MNQIARSYRFLVIVAILLAAGISPAVAQHINPHILYEQNCARCHAPHAGEFVVATTDFTENGLVGRMSEEPVRGILEDGHGRLTPVGIDVLMAQFESIQNSGRLFHEKCGICHDNARTLARLELVLRDDEIIGRYSGRDIALFLKSHGRMSGNEAGRMVEVLKRQLSFE